MIMKKYVYLVLGLLLFCYSCSDNNDNPEDPDNGYKTYSVAIQLSYPAEEGGFDANEGVKVKLSSTTGTVYDATTNAKGKATFTVPVGIYEVSASDKKALDGYSYIYNGIKSNVVVNETWVNGETIELPLILSKSGQIVIKELYVGGCPKNDGSGNYQFDKYVILYNNSETPATLENLCLGMVNPYNANSSINDYVNGVLSYADQNFIPAGCAIWYLPTDLTIEGGKQVTIAMNGAVNHTLTYSKSVDLSHADYCTYDIEDFNQILYYPAPSEASPSSHYFTAYKYGAGTAWALSNSSPAFFVFTTHDQTPVEFASNVENQNYIPGREGNLTYIRTKVPTNWILDAVEVFAQENVAKSQKRLTPTVDAGYTVLTNAQGYTSYRNVDKEATEALAANDKKLVYSYSKGTEGSTDPSGIDAEASIKNGARIIYQDTNNSSNDFHQRSQASLRD